MVSSALLPHPVSRVKHAQGRGSCDSSLGSSGRSIGAAVASPFCAAVTIASTAVVEQDPAQGPRRAEPRTVTSAQGFMSEGRPRQPRQLLTVIITQHQIRGRLVRCTPFLPTSNRKAAP